MKRFAYVEATPSGATLCIGPVRVPLVEMSATEAQTLTHKINDAIDAETDARAQLGYLRDATLRTLSELTNRRSYTGAMIQALVHQYGYVRDRGMTIDAQDMLLKFVEALSEYADKMGAELNRVLSRSATPLRIYISNRTPSGHDLPRVEPK